MKWPYHLVQAGQMGRRHVAQAFDSPGATSAPQHAHRTLSALGAAWLDALAFEVVMQSLIATGWGLQGAAHTAQVGLPRSRGRPSRRSATAR